MQMAVKNVGSKLAEEQALLLKMMAHQAAQIHALMAQLGLEYDTSTGKLKAMDGSQIDEDSAADNQFFLMAQPKFKQLVEVLSSAFSGKIFDQSLAVQSYPRIVLKFAGSSYDAAKTASISAEFAAALSAAIGEVLAADPLTSVSVPSAAEIEPLVSVMEEHSKTVIVFRMKRGDADSTNLLNAMGGSDVDGVEKAQARSYSVSSGLLRLLSSGQPICPASWPPSGRIRPRCKFP